MYSTTTYKPTATQNTLKICLGLGILACSMLSLASVSDDAIESAFQQPKQQANFQQPKLKPYTATYKASIKGLSATLTRTLKSQDDGLWQLHNNASAFLATVEESSQLRINKNTVTPLNYHYRNPLSSKRNSSLQFDWGSRLVRDDNNPNISVPLQDDSYDKLSFQLQLRLDLMHQGQEFGSKQYQLIDKDRVKTYRVEMIGKERLATPAGVFETVKLKQYRPGKNKYTLIWMAKDWQYLILKLERFKDDKSENSLQLQEASIDDKPLLAPSS